VDDAPEPDLRRPIERPRIQTFDDKIQERLAWGEEDKWYKATVHALEESLRNLNVEKDLQAQEAEGEKKSLISENKTLCAQFQQMKKASEAPVRS